MKHLAVRLHGTRVATLTAWEDNLDTHAWEPERAWVRDPHRAVLGQLWEARGARPLETHGFTPWFEHLLPQGPLRRAIARAASVDEDDGMALLAWLGDDLLGAVAVEAAEADARLPRPAPLVVAETGTPYRSALPGNQWKLSLAEDSSGYTIPMHGGEGAWIAKLPTGKLPRLVEVEAATMAWAKASGVVVPEVRVVPATALGALPQEIPRAEPNAYLIRRFDRTPAGRVHTEDFGQVLDTPPGPALFQSKYEYIAAVLAKLCPPEDLRAFVRQLVFCIVAGNTDAHTKNWTLLYPDGRHPRLSPAYDLVAVVVYPEAHDGELALSLGGSKALHGVTEARFRALARVCGVDEATVAQWFRDDVERARTAWAAPEVHDRFSALERTRIDQHMARALGG